MRKSGFGRVAPVLAVLGWVGACADQPSPLGPMGSVAGPLMSEVGIAGEGELIICKDGGGETGTFTFDYSFVTLVGTTDLPGGSVSVDAGSCATVVANPGPGRWRATITEQAPPANWALTNITIVPSIAGSGNPSIDLANRTASANISNDLGETFTFTNTFTPPVAGCTFTQGYWKTHSEFGPAPYNNTWALLASGASTGFYLSGQSWYQVFHTPPGGNAYYNLAHQFQAATLNTLWGASVPANVAAALATANTLFSTYTPAQIGALKGSNSLRQQFIALAGTLDAYNNGITGPGHCGA